MDWHQYVRTQLADITGDAARDAEIVEEIAQDLAQRYDEARAAGANHEQAVALAASQVREHSELAWALREADRPRPAHPLPPSSRGTNVLHDLWIDARYASRLLRRTPAFTSAAILTLALGIGVTIAIFNVIDAVLLRPSPYPDISRLVMVWETDRASGTTHEPASLPDLLDFKAQSRSLDRIGALTAVDGSLQPDAGDPVRVAALAVTPDVLEVIGARAVRGRLLHASDDRPDAARTVLISDHLWKAAYGGRDLVGQSIRVNDVPRTVVGIVPTDTDFGMVQILRAADYGGGFATRDPRTRVDVWLPLQGDPARLPRSTHPILLLGRLAPRVTLPAAHDELSRIAARLEAQYRNDNDKRGVNTQALSDVVFGPVEPSLVVLMTAVALILVMACANVANLLLTRGTRRLREVAVRSALGAETMRLARQFVAENIVLAMASATVSLVLAFLALRALAGLAPGEIPRVSGIGLDARAMLLAFAGAAAIALVFSLMPIVQMRRAHLSALLKSEERVTGGRDARRIRSILVVSEVALAVVLVTGAGLLIRTFWTLRTTSPGFDAASTLKIELQLPQSRYPIRNTPLPVSPAIERFNGELLQRVSSLPGVQAAAFAVNHPLDGGFASSFLVVDRESEAADWPEISIRRVSRQYFSTLRIPLLGGRVLDDRDRTSSPAGVVVNQAVKDRMFAHDDPVGHDIRMWGTTWRIVGVVGSERSQGVAKEAPIAIYLPIDVVPANAEALIVRTSGDLSTLAATLRGLIRELDPGLAVYGVEPLEQTLTNSLVEQRFIMLLLSALAALALALAAIGIHGVLSITVAQQQRELGIRMALGADAGSVLRVVFREGATLTGIGLVVGCGLALALARFLSGMLVGVSSTDIPTLAGVIVVLGVVAAGSIWIPARRAVSVDPLVALKQE